IPLEFIRELPKIVVTEAPSKEKPVVLECELSRKPKEPVKWLHNGKPLPSRLPRGVTVEEEEQSTIHRITFTELTEDDLGEYTVQVEKIASTGGVEMKSECIVRHWVVLAVDVGDTGCCHLRRARV
ncbi:Obscurin, partial [Taenia solium]